MSRMSKVMKRMRTSIGAAVVCSLVFVVGFLTPSLVEAHQMRLLDISPIGQDADGISQGVLRMEGDPWRGPHTRLVDGKSVYRARGNETLRGIAERVYGDPDMWRLILNANRDLLTGGGTVAPSYDLIIPPPPSARIVRGGDKVFIEVLPGDTFAGLAQALYGRAELWPLLYQANQRLIESPATAQALMATGGRASLLFVAPPPGATVAAGSPSYPPQVQAGVAPADYQQVPSGDAGRLAATGRAIANLQLRGPQDIGRREAEIILRDTGFIGRRNTTFAAAMAALRQGYTYRRGSQDLNAESREWLFREYTLYRQALARYGQHPTISAQATPDLYERWVRDAAQHLTAVPAAQRERLMQSLMVSESSRTHWSNYTPVVSNAGAVGIGQFLPATAQSTGINHHDPRENILGIAKYLNGLIRRRGVRRGLAEYNGGNNPPSSSYRYADTIMRRAGVA